jgi:iron only hydrogenase large subunit-like protein
VCYAEKTTPQVNACISTTKSPQQITGTLLKLVFNQRYPSNDIFFAAVMPCADKKLEAARMVYISLYPCVSCYVKGTVAQDFFHDDLPAHETDLVLTTSELLQIFASQVQEDDEMASERKLTGMCSNSMSKESCNTCQQKSKNCSA